MRSLTDLFPSPRRVAFGGAVVLVDELRVRDAIRLQEWLDARAPDPLASLGPLVHARYVAPEDRPRFSEAIDLAAEGPPAWGGARAAAEFAEVVGLVAFLKVVLRKNYGMTDLRVLELLEAFRPGELDAVLSAAYRTSPGDELDRAVRRLTGAPSPPPGDGYDWGKWVDEVARSHGWTYEQIAGLTLTQFSNALNEGKPPRKANPEESPRAARKRWDRWIGGDDGATADGKGAT